MTINVGDKAPAFTLKSTDFEDVSLTDYSNNNVVIIFFPMAFSSVCTAEVCQVRDDAARYNELGAQVLAISVDSPFALAKFKAENQLEFPVLSDFNKEVSVAYDAFYEEFALGLKGVAKRAAFIVGKDGNVKYAEVLESPKNLPNFEAIKQTLSDLQ